MHTWLSWLVAIYEMGKSSRAYALARGPQARLLALVLKLVFTTTRVTMIVMSLVWSTYTM